MINRLAHRIWIAKGEVHRLPADPADRLRRIDLFTVTVQGCPVLPEFVRAVVPRHFIPTPGGIFKMGAGVCEVSQWMSCTDKGETVPMKNPEDQ